MAQNNTQESWHVGKEIPITLIATILLQTFGGVWWAATLTQKFDNIISDIATIKNERYTKSDSVRDLTIIDYKIIDLTKRLDKLEK